jgi:hypothetical protein
MTARVSLVELASAGLILHSAEAAVIVVEVCRQYSHGLVPGIPSAPVIRLTSDGCVVAEGPITTDHPPLAKAAHLLNDLLPPFGAPPAYRVPGGLRLVVARALGALGLPAFESLDDFSRAVARFAADDLTSTALNLFRAWEYAQAVGADTREDGRPATALLASAPPRLARREPVMDVRPRHSLTILRASASAAALALLAYVASMERWEAPNWMRAGPPQELEFVPEFVSADAPLDRMASPLPVQLMNAHPRRPAAAARVSKPCSPAKHASAAPAATRRSAKPNFFKRELLRIIIK